MQLSKTLREVNVIFLFGLDSYNSFRKICLVDVFRNFFLKKFSENNLFLNEKILEFFFKNFERLFFVYENNEIFCF